MPIPAVAYFIRRLWQTSEQRHSIGLELWRGETLQGSVKPVHVVGVPVRVIKEWEAGAIAMLREAHGESEAVVREERQEHPNKCPIENCPLRS